jgi:hypothetical protein
MILIALLGEKNDEEGNLTPIARSRCDEAIKILKEEPSYKVIPTGSFGLNFNTSDKAHGLLLRDYLLSQGISNDRILPPANSTNTHEDALCVNRVARDQECSKVIVVTSDYHMKRSQYIFLRVMKEMELEFRAVNSNSPFAEMQKDRYVEENHEEHKLEKIKKEWIDVPIYKRGRLFPKDVYEGASNDHSHYDKVSLAIVTGIIFIFAYPFFAKIEIEPLGGKWSIFLLNSMIIIFLLFMYLRAAMTARTARRTMRLIEVAFDERGFSSNYNSQFFINKFPSIMNIVLALSALFVILSLLSAMYVVNWMAFGAVVIVSSAIIMLLYQQNRLEGALNRIRAIWKNLVN